MEGAVGHPSVHWETASTGLNCNKNIIKMSEYNFAEDWESHMCPLPHLNTLILIETVQNISLPNESIMHLTDEAIPFDDDCDVSLEIAVQEIELTKKKALVNTAVEVEVESPPSRQMKSTAKKVGCSCKKTKCMKMYCECYAEGYACRPECNCCDCENQGEKQGGKQITEHFHRTVHMSSVLLRKKEKKGCNCRRTMCLKKYCECFGLGKKCGQECSCVGCENCLKK